jgi:hypothetical protein
MLVDDASENIGSCRVVPDTVWVNNEERTATALAEPQAFDPSSVNEEPLIL